MVLPWLRKCQKMHENSRGTVVCLRRLTANLHGCCAHPVSRLVSLRQAATRLASSPGPSPRGGGGLETRLPPDLLANVTATNYALQGTCFTLCQVERAILWKQRKHRPLFSHPIFCQMHVHCQAHISLLSAVISPIPRSPPSTLQE